MKRKHMLVLFIGSQVANYGITEKILCINIQHSAPIVREQDICDKEIKNKKELCYNASDQTNKITGDPSYETYYNRRTETS